MRKVVMTDEDGNFPIAYDLDSEVLLSLNTESTLILIGLIEQTLDECDDPRDLKNFDALKLSLVVQLTHQEEVHETIRRTLGVQPAQPDTEARIH